MTVSLDFKPHEKQAEIFFHPAKTKVIDAGRRFGKDIVSLWSLLIKCIELAQNREPDINLNPHVLAWVVAPSYGIIQQAWRDFKGIVPEVLIPRRRNQLMMHDSPPFSMWIDACGGDKRRYILVEFKSAERYDDLVGTGLDFLVMTEAARVDERAWEVVKPTLRSPGRAGYCILNSTPKGKNWFWQEWEHGQEGGESVASWQYTTFDNPHLTPEQVAEIEQDRERMGERWYRQEVLAEFVDAAGSAIDSDDVDNCAVTTWKEPEEGRFYTAGADFGRYEDDSVLVIGDPLAGEVVHIVAIKPGQSIEYVSDQFAQACERYNHAWVWADRTQLGEAYVMKMREKSVTVKPIAFTQQSKQQIYEWGISLIERGAIKYPPDPNLLKQLKDLEYEQTPAGYVRYTHPRKGHDDYVTALFLWCQSIQQRKPEVLLVG